MMTPELTKEIIVGCVAALATALFTGIPAALLVWWTWQRDQERLIVKKLIPNWPTLTGEWVAEKDEFGPLFDILIRNRSLFPVYVSAGGFLIDGEIIELENPFLPVNMKKNPDPSSNRPYIADEDSDPKEIPSQKFTTLHVCGNSDRARIGDALKRAAKKHNTSVEKILTSSKVVAVIALQSGNEFTSETYLRGFWRGTKTRIKLRWKTAMGNRWLTAIGSLAVGSAFFTLWFWLLPQWLGFHVEAVDGARWRWAAAVPSMLGFTVALRCVWDFGWTGRGTPAPVVPPQKLVVVGFYRYTRNPMYLGFALGWIGLWVVFGHANLTAILVVAAVALGVHLFVVFYEEPTLRRKFDADYEEYARNVDRWWPRVHAWDRPH